MCPGKLRNISDCCEHRSLVKHLSQTEVGSVKKKYKRSCSEAGWGNGDWEGALGSIEHSCKQSERHEAPSTDSASYPSRVVTIPVMVPRENKAPESGA